MLKKAARFPATIAAPTPSKRRIIVKSSAVKKNNIELKYARKNKILGDAYGLDEEFFDFLRTMQACKDTFGDTEMSMVIAPGEVCEKFFGEIDIQN